MLNVIKPLLHATHINHTDTCCWWVGKYLKNVHEKLGKGIQIYFKPNWKPMCDFWLTYYNLQCHSQDFFVSTDGIHFLYLGTRLFSYSTSFIWYLQLVVTLQIPRCSQSSTILNKSFFLLLFVCFFIWHATQSQHHLLLLLWPALYLNNL